MAQNGVRAPTQQDGGGGDGATDAASSSSTCSASASKNPSGDTGHPHDHTSPTPENPVNLKIDSAVSPTSATPPTPHRVRPITLNSDYRLGQDDHDRTSQMAPAQI